MVIQELTDQAQVTSPLMITPPDNLVKSHSSQSVASSAVNMPKVRLPLVEVDVQGAPTCSYIMFLHCSV